MSGEPSRPTLKFKAMILGCAQDSGIPSIGCSCSTCSGARKIRHFRDGLVSCLGLVDQTEGKAFLVGATSSISTQLWELQESIEATENNINQEVNLEGILLTHAGVGHITGLLDLGREGLDCRNLPVFCSESVLSFIRTNLPWSLLIDRNNITVTELAVGATYKLSKSITVQPISVPPVNELSNCTAFLFGSGINGKLLYCPSTSTFNGWEPDIRDICSNVEVAILDGTYFSASELSEGASTDLNHPFIKDTAKILQGMQCEVVLTHFNHTNPALRTSSNAYYFLKKQNLKMARFGKNWQFTELPSVEDFNNVHPLRRKVSDKIDSVIDWNAAVEQCGGDEEFLMELLVDLWNEIQDHIKVLDQMVPEGQLDQCGRISHAIKGASSNLMCHRVKDAAFAMERVGSYESRSSKPSHELQHDLEITFAVLKDEVEKFGTFLKSIKLV